MIRIKEFLKLPKTTLLLFLVAVALLLTGTIGGSRAALTYFSENYTSHVDMYDIGVTLLENGEKVSWRNYDSEKADGTWDEVTGVLLKNMLPEGDHLLVGQPYKEELSAQNTGNIDEYVRVVIYKYWVNENGEKLLDQDPALIDLNYVNLEEDNDEAQSEDVVKGKWIIDNESSTKERTVLYYDRLVPIGKMTEPLSDTLTISSWVPVQAEPQTSTTVETRDGRKCKVVTTTYNINGMLFQLEAEVDAVQTHNAADGIRSAWGIDPALFGLTEEE